LATRLDGAKRYRSGRGEVENFGYEEVKQVQRLLNRRGFDTGGVDGKHGAKSRAAVKAAQIKFGLPADSYPSRELVRRLR
ncbi:MAG: peptidoglycan-binding domain-containing protein, partial [Pseudomonadota bacterium]